MLRKIVTATVGFAVLIIALEGCSGGGGGGSGGPPSGSLTVTLRAMSRLGQPFPNLAVWISGNGPFVTDANGEATATGMPSPYDVVVVNGAGGIVDVWPGLTRPDPVFVLADDSAPASFRAMIDGTVSGGVGFPVPPTHETDVFAVFGPFGSSSLDADPMTGAFSFTSLNWLGSFVVDIELVGLQYLADMNGDPVTFTGFGTRDIIDLLPNEHLTNQDITLAPVPTTLITGSLSLPPGMNAFGKLVLLTLASGGSIAIPSGSNFLPTFSLPAPVAPGTSRGLLAFAADAMFSGGIIIFSANLPDPASNLVITVPDPTGLVLPIDGALDVDHDTVFQVTPSPGDRVFVATFFPLTIGPTIRLHTTASTFTIPDVSAFGAPIPAGAEYTWSVDANGPLTSLDEATAPTAFFIAGFLPLVSNGTGDAFLSEAPKRGFTFGQ